MNLDELIGFAERNARTWLIGGKNELPPTFVLVTPKGNEIMVTPWASTADKARMTAFMRLLMKQKGATAYCFFDEAWAAKIESEEEVKAVNEGRAPNASKRPDRYEVVMAYASDGLIERSRSWLIKRDESGDCVELEPDVREIGMIGGRFANLLSARM